MALITHQTVLLNEAVAALITDKDGCYVDGTYGRGGHSCKILEQLSHKGRLIAIDKDPQAIEQAQQLAARESRFEIVHGSFAELGSILATRNPLDSVSGVLLDLGVSSPQLDQPERGFSFLHDGPLDMRMNSASGLTAEQWVNSADEQEITTVLKEYGEEKFARRMAKFILNEREKQAITTTGQLAEIISAANPAWEKGKHPATRAFQAIRIHINDELHDLQVTLNQALEVLRVGGRLVVISFHSLEDRIVKRFIRKHERGDDLPAHLPVTEDQLNKRLRSIGKAVKASAIEVEENVRSRSAIMRVAEKIK